MTNDDLISRQAVLDILQKYTLGESKIAEEVNDLSHIVSQQAKWIPVSEKLPKQFDYVLCCIDTEIVFMATYLGRIDGVDCFSDSDGMIWKGKATAWMDMKIPKPYKEESEDKE